MIFGFTNNALFTIMDAMNEALNPCKKCGSVDRYAPTKHNPEGRCKCCAKEGNAKRSSGYNNVYSHRHQRRKEIIYLCLDKKRLFGLPCDLSMSDSKTIILPSNPKIDLTVSIHTTPDSLGVDLINPELGYIKSNLRFTTYSAVLAKKTLPTDAQRADLASSPKLQPPIKKEVVPKEEKPFPKYDPDKYIPMSDPRWVPPWEHYPDELH